MRLKFALASLLALSCASSQMPVAPPKLAPPVKEPVIRKTFSGDGWKLTVDNENWVKGSSDFYQLALLDVDRKIVILLLQEELSSPNLEDYAKTQEAAFKDELLVLDKNNQMVGGFPGNYYELGNSKSRMWVWLTVANQTGYTVVCGTEASLADKNQTICAEIVSTLTLTTTL